MSEIEAKGTHYMTFPHTTAGLGRTDFEISIYKNGEVIADIGYEVLEGPDTYYTLSFDNDGTDYSTWTCIVHDPDEADLYYVESWRVRKKTVETNVKQIRSRQDSEGGFFKSSTEEK